MNYMFYFALFGFVISQFSDGFNGMGSNGFNGMNGMVMGSNGFNGMNGMGMGSNGFNGMSGMDGFGGLNDEQQPSTQPEQPTGSPTLPSVTIRFLDLSHPPQTPIPQAAMITPIPETSLGSNPMVPFGLTTASVTTQPFAAFPTANLTTSRQQDESKNSVQTIAIVLSSIAVLVIIAASAYFLYRRRTRMQRPAFPHDYDEENQKKQMQQLSPTPPKLKIPSHYKLETMQGPQSSMSETSVFETRKAFTPTKTDSYFVSSFNRDHAGLSAIEEEHDTDVESLYEVQTVRVKVPLKAAKIAEKRDSMFENLRYEIEQVHRR